jgi:lysyl-tRNA synthetase class 2
MLFLFDAASNAAKVTAHDFDIFRFIPGYSEHIVGDGKEPVLLLLLAFLITFALTRLYTRLARRYGWGSGSVGGVHLHHMVVGIFIIIATALVAVAEWPTGIGRDLIAIFFGVGAALILDEFALSLYLEDVYWSPKGRMSVDAAIMGVMLAGLLLVGISPFGVDDAHYSRTYAFGVVAVNVVLASITLLKGKLMLGLASIFIPIVGLIGAIRLAKPQSAWAKWFYRHSPQKLDRARQRYEVNPGWAERFNVWFTNLIGGAPSQPSPGDAPPSES